MKKVLAGFIASILMICGMCGVVVAPTYAEGDAFSSICEDESIKNNPDAWQRAGCGDFKEGLAATEDPTFNLLINLINIIIGLASIITVIFIVIGGINFMTSTGDAGKIKKAKDTILYAAIGLVICMISAVVVNWVIAKAILGK